MNAEAPQTDIAKFTFQDACLKGMRPDRELVDAFFAGTLEKERDQARAEAAKWRDYWASSETLRKIGCYKFPWENEETADAK